MPSSHNNNQFGRIEKKEESIDSSPINNQLNNDNAFSDNGLDNAIQLEKSLNKTKTK